MEHISESLKDTPLVGVTYGTIVRAFTEWDRLWRENPDKFDSDIERILRGETIEEYGQYATLTLLEMIGRVTINDETVENIPNVVSELDVSWFELTDRHGMISQYTPREGTNHLTASIAEQQRADKIQARLKDGTYVTLKDRHGGGG